MRHSLLTPTLLLAAAALLAAPLQAQETGVAGINAAQTEQVRAKLAKLSVDEIKQVASAAAKIATDKSQPASARVGAVRSLGLLQCRVGIPALKALFAEPALADDARAALQRIPGPETKTALLEGLGAVNDAKLQAGFIDSLGAVKATVAIATIKGYLGNASPLVSEAAQRALAAIGTPDSFEALASAKDSDLKRDLQIDLGAKILQCPKCAAGRPAVLAVLRELSKSTADADAALAAFLLRFRYQDADAAAGLKSESAIERRAAATFLNGSRDVESGKVLEKALASTKGADLRPLLGAVASRAQASAVPILRELLTKESDDSVKADIVKTLGQIGGAAEVSLFADLLKTEALSEAAKEALSQVRGPGVTKSFTDLVRNASKGKDFRKALLDIIQRRNLRDAVPSLLPVLNDPDEDISVGALKIVERFATKTQITQIQAAKDSAKTELVKNRLTSLITKLQK